MTTYIPRTTLTSILGIGKVSVILFLLVFSKCAVRFILTIGLQNSVCNFQNKVPLQLPCNSQMLVPYVLSNTECKNYMQFHARSRKPSQMERKTCALIHSSAAIFFPSVLLLRYHNHTFLIALMNLKMACNTTMVL